MQEHSLDDWMENGNRALRVMNAHLTKHDFFVAGRFTIADIALYAYTHVAHLGDFDLSPYTAVRQWLARVEAQPDYVAMDRQPQTIAAE